MTRLFATVRTGLKPLPGARCTRRASAYADAERHIALCKSPPPPLQLSLWGFYGKIKDRTIYSDPHHPHARTWAPPSKMIVTPEALKRLYIEDN